MKNKISSKISEIIYLFYLIIFIFILFKLFIKPEQLLGYNFNLISNDYCQKYNSTMNNLEKLACDNIYKKDKFIWVQIDGIANDQLHEINNLNESKIIHFKILKLTGYKKSPRCHEIQLTGHPSRNIPFFPIKKDNLLLQMKNISMPINFIGAYSPLYRIINHLNLFKYAKTYNIPENYSFHFLCDNIDIPLFLTDEFDNVLIEKFSDSIGKVKEKYLNQYPFPLYEFMKNYLNFDVVDIENCIPFKNFYENRENLLYFTTNDNLNHNNFKHHFSTYKNLFVIESMFKKLLNFIDNNPEYILISGSDHGGQSFYGEDNIMNHGSNEFNNYPFHFFYTKELKDKYDEWKIGKQTIPVEKIAVTIPQLIKGINIPLEAIEFPLIIGDDPIFRIAACKSKEFQLRSLMEKYINKYPKNKNIFDDIILKLNNSEYVKNTDEIKFNKEYQEKYYEFLKDIQNDIFNKLYYTHRKIILYIFVKILFFLILYLLVYNLRKLYNNIFENNSINFKNIMFIFFIFIFINIENIFMLFENNNYYDALIKARFINYILITIFLGYILIIEKQLKNKIYLFYFFCLCFIIIFAFIIQKTDLFVKIKILFNYQYYNKIIDITISLPLSFFLMQISLSEFKKYYLDKNFNFSLYLILTVLNIIFHVLICIYDLNSSNLMNYTTDIIFYTIVIPIFLLILICLILFFFSYYINYSDINLYNQELLLYKHYYLFPILRIFYYYYHFYLSDMTEKLFLVIFIIPILNFTSYLYKRNSKKNFRHYKILYALTIIFHVELSFILFQKNYTFDVTIKETLNKTIGVKESKKHTIIGGLIIGSHILKYYLLLIFYLIDLLKLDSHKLLNNESNDIFILLKSYLYCVLIVFFLSINKIGIQNDNILEVLIWIIAKISIILIIDIIFIIFTNCKKIERIQKNKNPFYYELKKINDENINNNNNNEIIIN